MDLKDRFDKYDAEHLEFEKVKNPMSQRPDLNAFILLDKLCPGREDMIAASQHDEFYLSIDPETLNDVANDEDILTLVRCGVRYDEEEDSLCMFA